MKAATVLAVTGSLAGLLMQTLPAETIEKKIESSVQKIQNALPLLRFTSTDLLNPPRWETPHSLPEIENLLADPVRGPVKVADWNASLAKDHSPQALAAFMKKILTVQPNGFAEVSALDERYPELDKFPSELKNSVTVILRSIQKASAPLKKSYQDLTLGERRKILEYYDFQTAENGSSLLKTPRLRRQIFSSLKRFDQNSSVVAAGIVLNAVHEQLPALQRFASNASSQTYKGLLPFRIKTALGEVLILGKNDEAIDLQSLDGAALFLKLGGNNRYEGTSERQPEGRIRIAIDFGENITIRSTGSAAGTGIFGIDLFYLPNISGIKTIVTGSYSQGFGLCGVGGLFANGQGTFRARRHSQGVGIFGAGFFVNHDGIDSEYETQLYGQGVGFTRGLGIFIHRGDRAKLSAGLVDPDPRESLGTTSLSQGVGYGPRAYAGGGLGLCLLKGEGIQVESSYFAQGAGYWHAAGSFLLDGSSCSVKARRYDQGSGVHSAFGMFTLNGNDNKVLNWGVGPAFGWDSSIGWAFSLGDRNQFQTEWGAGSASLGASRSFSVFSGNRNRLDLPGLGSGQFVRDLSDLTISLIEGSENRLKSSQVKSPRIFSGTLYNSPWGMVIGDSTTLVTDLGFEKSAWQKLPAGDLPSEGQVNLESALNASESLGDKGRVEQLVQIAAAFSVDKAQPRRARAKLIALRPDELNYLLDALDFTDVDGLIQLRIIAALWGDTLMNRIPEAFKKEEDPQVKVLLLSMLTVSKAGTAVPVLFRALTDPDWRVQSAAVRVLGILLNQNPSNISGRVYILKLLQKYLASANPAKLRDELIQELTAQPYADAIGLISAAKNWSAFERATLLETAPADITSSIEEEQVKKVLSMLETFSEEAEKNIGKEVLDSEKLRRLARESLISLLAKIKPKGKELKYDPAPEALTYDILTAIGKMGSDEDAEKISHYLDAPEAKLREGAAVALARIGGTAKKFLEKKLSSWDAEEKMNAVAAVTETSDKTLIKLIERGLVDENPEVRRMSLSSIEKIQRPLNSEKEKLKEKIRNNTSEKQTHPIDAQKVYLFGEP